MSSLAALTGASPFSARSAFSGSPSPDALGLYTSVCTRRGTLRETQWSSSEERAGGWVTSGWRRRCRTASTDDRRCRPTPTGYKYDRWGPRTPRDSGSCLWSWEINDDEDAWCLLLQFLKKFLQSSIFVYFSSQCSCHSCVLEDWIICLIIMQHHPVNNMTVKYDTLETWTLQISVSNWV